MAEYESKLKTSSIRFTSRACIEINHCFYTVEASEERVVPEGVEGIDLDKERQLLWDTVNDECDNQINIIVKTSKK